MQFSGHFTITKKDNLRYNFFLMRKKLIATTILVFVIIAVMIGFIRYAQGASLTEAIGHALLMAVIGTLLLLAINVISTVLRVKNLYKQKKLTDFSVDFTVDKTGIHAVSSRGSSDLPWNRIVYVRETRTAFYIFITDTHANVMPKDQLKSAADAATIRALMEKNIEKNRRKLKQ